MVDNADRPIRTICSETGKAYEDAQIAEVNYGASAFGFWAKAAPKYLADQRVPILVGVRERQASRVCATSRSGWWA